MGSTGSGDSDDDDSSSVQAPRAKDRRPPPWEGLDARRSGRLLLVLAIASAAMYLFAGWLYFHQLTNPTFNDTTLYRSNPYQSDNPAIEDVDLYLGLSALYALASFIIGAWVSLTVRPVKVEKFGRVQLFTMVAPAVCFLPGAVFPVAREVLLFLPPGMLLLAASNLVHPENQYRPLLGTLGLLTVVPMLLGEAFLVAARPLGAAMMYLMMVACGLSALALISLAREEHLAWMGKGQGGKQRQPARSEGTGPGPLPGGPENLPPRPAAARRPVKPATIIVVAGAVLLVAFLPPLWVLDTGPDLEIYWQIRNDVDKSRTSRMHVRAMVVNRGAEAAVGLIELTVSYNLTDVHNMTGPYNIIIYPAGECERIDGFGSWYIETNITVKEWEKGNKTPMITLSFNGRELETQRLRVPAPGPLLALAAVLVIKALSDRRKRRGPANQ